MICWCSRGDYDLDEFEGYSMEKVVLKSITGSPWKLKFRLLDKEGQGMKIDWGCMWWGFC